MANGGAVGSCCVPQEGGTQGAAEGGCGSNQVVRKGSAGGWQQTWHAAFEGGTRMSRRRVCTLQGSLHFAYLPTRPRDARTCLLILLTHGSTCLSALASLTQCNILGPACCRCLRRARTACLRTATPPTCTHARCAAQKNKHSSTPPARSAHMSGQLGSLTGLLRKQHTVWVCVSGCFAHRHPHA